jgi:hypothetical protein
MTHRTPSYRYHKARDCAVVTIAGRDRYLGKFQSPESPEDYHRLVAEHLATKQKHQLPDVAADTPLTITELTARY